MTVQEAIDEVMSMKFAGGCGQYTKEAVLIVCAAAKHAIEESESKKQSMAREEAIEILSGMIVATHVKDISIGTVEEVRESLRFALSDMEKVEKLEGENARLKERYERRARTCNELSDGINELEAEIERMREKLAEARGERR